jgi:tetratricopeptide (TPR) repeat protein
MIGKQIKYFRLQKQAKQEELAEYLGVSYQAVSKWETGASDPDISLLPKLAIFFGVSIDELFELPYEEQMQRIENMIFNERRIHPDTFRQAISFLEERLKQDPKDLRALGNLASIYNHRAHSDHELASEYAQKVLEMDPDDKGGWVDFLEAKGGVCGDEWYDNHFEVIRFFKELLEKYPENYRCLYALLENMIADGRYDEAIPYIEQIKKAKKNHQYLLYTGDVAFGKGRVEEAKETWEKMVKEFPDEWQAFCDLGDGYAKLGMYDEAIKAYEKSFDMQEKPRIAEGLCSMAQLHESQKEYDKAIKDYQRLIENLREDYDVTEGEQVDRYVREIARLKGIKKNK